MDRKFNHTRAAQRTNLSPSRQRQQNFRGFLLHFITGSLFVCVRAGMKPTWGAGIKHTGRKFAQVHPESLTEARRETMSVILNQQTDAAELSSLKQNKHHTKLRLNHRWAASFLCTDSTPLGAPCEHSRLQDFPNRSSLTTGMIGWFHQQQPVHETVS